MCEICGEPGKEPATCEEALADGLITDSCSLCGKHEECPFYLWLYHIEDKGNEMTIQVCDECGLDEKNKKLVAQLEKLQTEPKGNCPNCNM